MSFVDFPILILPRTNITTIMEHIELSEDIKEIINKLRIIGGDMDAIEIYRTSVGWQYGGSKIESQLNYLNAEFDGKRGNKVRALLLIITPIYGLYTDYRGRWLK